MFRNKEPSHNMCDTLGTADLSRCQEFMVEKYVEVRS